MGGRWLILGCYNGSRCKKRLKATVVDCQPAVAACWSYFGTCADPNKSIKEEMLSVTLRWFAATAAWLNPTSFITETATARKCIVSLCKRESSTFDAPKRRRTYARRKLYSLTCLPCSPSTTVRKVSHIWPTACITPPSFWPKVRATLICGSGFFIADEIQTSNFVCEFERSLGTLLV